MRNGGSSLTPISRPCGQKSTKMRGSTHNFRYNKKKMKKERREIKTLATQKNLKTTFDVFLGGLSSLWVINKNVCVLSIMIPHTAKKKVSENLLKIRYPQCKSSSETKKLCGILLHPSRPRLLFDVFQMSKMTDIKVELSIRSIREAVAIVKIYQLCKNNNILVIRFELYQK